MIGQLPLELAERGWVPDPAVRWGIRRLSAQRLRDEERLARAEDFERELRASPIALVPQVANQQHYEVPAAFFEQVLGRHLKYSACWFANPHDSLDDAEAAMLALTCERAGLEDGMRILELGCGWGSLSLWMARAYPRARIVAVSNSRSQREFIGARAPANLEVRTRDVNTLELDERFDRVVSVEMMEHVRNHAELLRRIAGWLAEDGKLFVHIFCHGRFAYPFDAEGAGDWMGRNFFTGGMMPSANLLTRYQQHLTLEQRWMVNGTHYQRTAEAWLERLDARRTTIEPVLAAAYGAAEAARWHQRWRMFFMSCAELFGYRGGREWQIGHYLFGKRRAAASQ